MPAVLVVKMDMTARKEPLGYERNDNKHVRLSSYHERTELSVRF